MKSTTGIGTHGNVFIDKDIAKKLKERGRDWHILLRIDWKSGIVMTELRHNSVGASYSAANGLELNRVLSSNMRRGHILELADYIQPLIEKVREEWYPTIGTDGKMKGFYTDKAHEWMIEIGDAVDFANLMVEVR